MTNLSKGRHAQADVRAKLQAPEFLPPSAGLRIGNGVAIGSLKLPE